MGLRASMPKICEDEIESADEGLSVNKCEQQTATFNYIATTFNYLPKSQSFKTPDSGSRRRF